MRVFLRAGRLGGQLPVVRNVLEVLPGPLDKWAAELELG